MLIDETKFLIRKRYLEQYTRPENNARPHNEPQAKEVNQPMNSRHVNN